MNTKTTLILTCLVLALGTWILIDPLGDDEADKDKQTAISDTPAFWWATKEDNRADEVKIEKPADVQRIEITHRDESHWVFAKDADADTVNKWRILGDLPEGEAEGAERSREGLDTRVVHEEHAVVVDEVVVEDGHEQRERREHGQQGRPVGHARGLRRRRFGHGVGGGAARSGGQYLSEGER